jgi:hypothetical protein
MGFPLSGAIWIVSLLIASPALAQTTPSSPTDPSAPPLSGSIGPTNGFTEGDVKSRFEARGYSNVHGLHKDTSGIWHGTRTRNGKTFRLNLDVQGNVGIE